MHICQHFTFISVNLWQKLKNAAAACLAWSRSLVSTSSWSERRFGSTTAEPLVRHTAFNPSLNPPPRTTFCWGPKYAGKFFVNDSQRKAAKFCLFFGFEIYFDHCFGTGVDPLWMLISNELDSPLLLRSPALIETGLYWSKIRSTLV